jgi:hypothetical protein
MVVLRGTTGSLATRIFASLCTSKDCRRADYFKFMLPNTNRKKFHQGRLIPFTGADLSSEFHEKETF